MRKEHYQPTLSDRNYRKDWERAGRKESWAKASETVRRLLKNHNVNLPEEVRDRVLKEIKGIVA
jgi:trimethylamine:corrinoid methyltransferase-like protein